MTCHRNGSFGPSWSSPLSLFCFLDGSLQATSSTHRLVEPLNPRGCLQVFVVFNLSKASDPTDSSLSVKLTFIGSHEASGSSPVLLLIHLIQ